MEETIVVQPQKAEPTLGSLGNYIAYVAGIPQPHTNDNDKMREIVDVLSRVDTSNIIKKKSTGRASLSYLSWAKAWEIILKHFPGAQNDVMLFDGKPYLNLEPAGFFVVTYITINGVTRYMWLPVMDETNDAVHATPTKVELRYADREGNKERTIKALNVIMLNKTIMRCLVKNAAMFGLGLNLYNGEDLPDAVREERERNTVEERKLAVMKDRVVKLGKLKCEHHRKEVNEIMMKYNNGSANPADIEDVGTCETIIAEFNKLGGENN